MSIILFFRFELGTEQLKQINGALNVGVSPEKIVETFNQCIPYTRFPKVFNAIFTAKIVFASKVVPLF